VGFSIMHTNSAGADRPSLVTTVVVVVAAVLLWILVLGELLFIVPLFEAAFADFHLRVPQVTGAIIACTRWCTKYPYVLPMPLAIITTGVAVSTLLIRHQLRKGVLGAAWCLAMLLLPAVVAFLIWLGCYLPYQKLLEGLAAQKG
jgi:type II secretory pathway component PulF